MESNDLTLLWVKSQPVIATFIGSLVPEANDAEDILQEVAMITIRKFDRYDGQRPFTAWAIGIAKKEILQYHHRRGMAPILLNDQAVEYVTSLYLQKAESIHDRKSDVEWALAHCIGKLQNRWKQILELHYRQNQTAVKIAQEMKLTESNVLVILHRARQALRTCIGKQLGQENL